MKRLFSTLFAAVAMATAAVQAQTGAGQQPVIHKFAYSDNAIATRLSDNGKWAVAQAAYTETRNSGNAKLVNTETEAYVELQTAAEVTRDGACDVQDVTDDGTVVVGAYKGTPAYWSKATGTWTLLPVPGGKSGGLVYAVTPDGKYAAGSCYSAADNYIEYATMWDLTADTVMTLANLPSLDMTHTDMK